MRELSPFGLDEKVSQEDEKASNVLEKLPEISFFKWADEDVKSTGNIGDYGNINNIHLHRVLIVAPIVAI